jgi:hypothetical protein
MEEKECGFFVPLDLDHECVSLFMLGFVLHEDSWEYDSYWCLGLGKMRSCKYFKEGNFTIRGDRLVDFWKERENN